MAKFLIGPVIGKVTDRTARVRGSIRWLAGALGAIYAAWPATAEAWDFDEHMQLCHDAYVAACADLQAQSESKALYVILCDASTPVREMRALQYGEACGVAGDRLGKPEEFLELEAGRFATSMVRYGTLALDNHEHFHPAAPERWQHYHQDALEIALIVAREAANQENPSRAFQSVQRALYHNAFADHFLQDAFSAGHMAFNRPASSAAAAKRYHDRWNKAGRSIETGAGKAMRAFGDGHLGQHTGREVLQQATKLSVRAVLRAALLGKRSPEDDQEIVRSFPVSVEWCQDYPILLSALRSMGGLQDKCYVMPTAGIAEPAKVDLALGASSSTLIDAQCGDADPECASVAALGTIAFQYGPFIKVPVYITLGAGMDEDSHLALDADYEFPLGFTNDGLLSHSVMARVTYHGGVGTVVGGGYGLGVEVGPYRIPIKVAAGQLVDGNGNQEGDLFLTFNAGFDWVLRAWGGGPSARGSDLYGAGR